MKKLFISLVLIISTATAAMAELKPLFSTDVNFQVPFLINLKSASDDNVVDVMGSVGVNAEFQIQLTRALGALVETGFYFPVGHVIEDENENRITFKQSSFDSWWGFNAFLGPSFRLADTRFFSLFISPGYTFATQYIKKDSTDFSYNSVIHGFGVNFNGRMNINKRMYIHLSEEASFYFYEWNKEESWKEDSFTEYYLKYDESEKKGCAYLSFTESIGFGIKF